MSKHPRNRDSIGENGGKYVRCRDDTNAQSYTC